MRPFVAGDAIPTNDGFWRGLLRKARSRAVLPEYPLRARPHGGRTLLSIDEPPTADARITAVSGSAYSAVEQAFDLGSGRFIDLPGGRSWSGNLYEYNRRQDVPIGSDVEVAYTSAGDWRFEYAKECCDQGPGPCVLIKAPAAGTIRWTRPACHPNLSETALIYEPGSTVWYSEYDGPSDPYETDWGFTLNSYSAFADYQAAHPEVGTTEFLVGTPVGPLLSAPFVVWSATLTHHEPAGVSPIYGPYPAGPRDGQSIPVRLRVIVGVDCESYPTPDSPPVLVARYACEYQAKYPPTSPWQSGFFGTLPAFPLVKVGSGPTLGWDHPGYMIPNFCAGTYGPPSTYETGSIRITPAP